ncbi:hypothetical protein KC320_g9202, partial [Hortaea werneckii]
SLQSLDILEILESRKSRERTEKSKTEEVNKGAEVNAQGGEYGNALQAALEWGFRETVQLLLDKGAEVNAEGGWYGNALQAVLQLRGQGDSAATA